MRHLLSVCTSRGNMLTYSLVENVVHGPISLQYQLRPTYHVLSCSVIMKYFQLWAEQVGSHQLQVDYFDYWHIFKDLLLQILSTKRSTGRWNKRTSDQCTQPGCKLVICFSSSVGKGFSVFSQENNTCIRNRKLILSGLRLVTALLTPLWNI